MNVSNLVIQNVLAKGGDGTSGIAGGGGGAGLGAGFFVDSVSATLNLSNVVFASAAAVGGNGGPVDLSPDATCGGAGGLGGRGDSYGAGGGIVGDANGFTGGVGWTSTVGNGQSAGPGQPPGPYMAQVGGGAAGCTSQATAGQAGFGGGGGAAFGENSLGGAGGYGGGGGGAPDTTSTQTDATAGAGGQLIDGKGGDGDIGGNGGGGAAAGPAVFVFQGIVSTSSVYYAKGSAAAGTGGKGNATADATPVFNAYGTVNGSPSQGGRADAMVGVFTVSTLPDATVGIAYTQSSISSVLATASNLLSVTSLPPGLSFANGAITGTPTTAGSYGVVLSVPLGSTSVSVTLPVTVGQGSQTITFDLGTTPTSDTTFTVAATATSGLPVTFASETPSVCTVSGSTVTIVSLGVCTITASQAGDSDWTAAAPVSADITIGKRAQTIAFDNPGNQPFTQGGSFMVTATASAGGTVTFTSSTPSVCTVSNTTVTIVSAGTCTITASQAGDAMHDAASATQNITIGLATQTIDFASPGGQTFTTGGTFMVSATASSGLAVTFTSRTTGVCTVAGTTVTMVTPGTCTIAADQAGNADYGTAPTVTHDIAVGKAAQTISLTTPGDQLLTTGHITLTSMATSGLPVTIASTTPSVCTITGGTVSFVAAGICTLDASQAGNATYAAASDVVVSFAIDSPTAGGGSTPDGGSATDGGATHAKAGGGGCSYAGPAASLPLGVVLVLLLGLCIASNRRGARPAGRRRTFRTSTT